MSERLNFKTISSTLQRDVILRGSLITAAATMLALLLLMFCIWQFLNHQLEARVENSLTVRHQIALTNPSGFTEEDRTLIRKFRRSLPIRDEGAFSWLNSDGIAFSNNVSGLECREEFYDRWVDISKGRTDEILPLIPKDQIDPEIHDRFRFLGQKHGDNCLVFGRSMYEADAIRDSVGNLFIWLVPLCILPALLFSLYQSLKLRRRLQKLGHVVYDISKGDLDARMPVSGDDDIDRLSKTANQSFGRLQESVNALLQLTSIMAHDLRAPLNRVAIPLDKAIAANRAGKPALEPLLNVQTGLEDARSIFDALLRISQIESGRRQANFSDIDLYEATESLFEIYQPVIEDDGRTLEFEVTGEGSGIVWGDIDLVRQALVNLIENAARYTPKGSVIRVGLSRESNSSVIFVKDNGPGVPEAERTKVLQRLYRFEGSTSGKSGHGLGLSLVKAVVELHGGEIILEDAQPGLTVIMQFGTDKHRT